MDVQAIGQTEPAPTGAVVDQVRGAIAEDPLIYVCACRGFLNHVVEDMCLRCLDAYAEGIQLLLTPKRIRVEMKRVARTLAKHLKTMPKVTVGEVLRAADCGLDSSARPALERA